MSLRDADAGRGVCAETCALLLDANCTGYTDSANATWGSDGNLRTIPTVIAVTAGPEKIPATRALLRRHRPATPQPPVRRLEQTSVRTVAEMVCGEVPFEAIVMTRTELRRDWQRNRCSCCAAYSS